MSILSGRKVETHEPGTLGSFGGWRDPKELENQADHAHRYYGRETPLDELEQRERLPQPRRHRPRQSRDPLALADPGAANVETWTRDATGVITFLRRPRKDEPGTLTELEHQHAARNREAADTEKARRRFLKDQQPQPVLRRDTSMSLKDALATIEHHEGRVTIGDYGELVVAVPGTLTAPPHDPLDEGEARQAVDAAADIVIFCSPVVRHLLETRKKSEPLSSICPAGNITAGGGVA